jgi:putative tricarboxylic transport membrane protein
MELKLREALDLSGGDISGLFNEGLAIFVYVLVVLAIVIPIVLARLRPGAVPSETLSKEESER